MWVIRALLALLFAALVILIDLPLHLITWLIEKVSPGSCTNFRHAYARFAMKGIELQGSPITLIMEEIHCLFLDREDPRQGLKTILAAIENVKSGISMFIFPEGTRSKVEGEFLPFHAGSFKIATKAKVPVVPVTLVGMGDIFEDHYPRLKRAPVVIEFGEPIETADMDINTYEKKDNNDGDRRKMSRRRHLQHETAVPGVGYA